MNHFASTYMQSLNKFATGSVVGSQPQKNKNTVLPTSIISQKDQQAPLNHSLSSLILMASPTKPSPPTTIPKSPPGSSRDQSASMTELMALNLSAGVFMKSTTKFLKGVMAEEKAITTQIQDKNAHLNSLQRKNNLIALAKNSRNNNQAPLNNDFSQKVELNKVPKFIRPGSESTIIYPSKEKIQRIARGESAKKEKQSRQRSSSQKLQQTPSRNRISTERSHNNSSKNQSSRSRSRSQSVSKFSRKKEKTRQLKFVDKKQERSETSINLLQPLPNKQNSPAANYKITNRGTLNEAKCIDNKSTNKPINNVNSEKKVETEPSIIVHLSQELKAPAKREPFKHLFTLSSGQLPLQTPVKPNTVLRIDSNKSLPEEQALKKDITRLNNQKVSTVKQEHVSDVPITNSTKPKQPAILHKISKEEASTYMHENPTEVAVCGEPGSISSKLDKNESTKAFISSTITKPNMGKNLKIEKISDSSSYAQLQRNIQKKPQIPKNIPLETIPSSSSALQQKKSTQSLQSANYKSINAAQNQISIRRSAVIAHSIFKIYRKKVENVFNLFRDGSKKVMRHNSESSILLNQALNFYINIYRKNIRFGIQQLKKHSLSNVIDKKPPLTLINWKSSACNIIFRTIQTKERQYFLYIKLMSISKLQLPITSQKYINHNEQKGQHKTSAIIRIIQISHSYCKNQIRRRFNKIMLFSIAQQKLAPSSLPLAKSPVKQTKPARDYSAEKKALFQSKDDIQTQIYRIQSRTANKRRSFNIQKSKLIKKQEEVERRLADAQREVNDKRQRNKALKGYLQQFVDSQDLDISLNCQPFVGLLTDIYTTAFRNKEESIDISQMTEKHSLLKEEPTRLLQQWNIMAQNIAIKSQLSRWEGAIKIPRPKEILISEQELIRKVLRSYIRQRYLWQWVHVASETL